ncbi:MAG: M48 family peptidase, partial [Methylococcaceae bacterium]|nr:M48 family peptidase [Methylococcaceae bacterium]
MHTFTIIFLIAVVISYAIQQWLSNRQKSHILEHRAVVPEAFKETVELEAHQKAADYTIAKGKLGDIDSIVGVIFLLLLT